MIQSAPMQTLGSKEAINLGIATGTASLYQNLVPLPALHLGEYELLTIERIVSDSSKSPFYLDPGCLALAGVWSARGHDKYAAPDPLRNHGMIRSVTLKLSWLIAMAIKEQVLWCAIVYS